MEERSMRVLEYPAVIAMLQDQAVSELGRAKAGDLRPTWDQASVLQSLQETSEAQSLLLKKGSLPFGGLYDVKGALKRTTLGSVPENIQFIRIGESLKTARRIHGFLKDFTSAPGMKQRGEALTLLPYLESRIQDIFLSEEEISDQASVELRRIRREMARTQENIRQKLQQIVSSSTAKYLQEPIVTMRQDRFVVPVKVEYKSQVPGILHDTSSSGATLFVEPMAVVEMNNSLRQLKGKESDEIQRILLELTYQVGEEAQAISMNQDLLTDLDFIMAKGRLSVHMKAVEPALNDQGFLDLRQARHPLLDSKKVVASNIYAGKNFHTLVITGPNTGGKTVTLKTIGLLSLMMQSGLHVPCDYGSTMCIFKSVVADIGDEQSIEQSLSTFSGHMTHIVAILKSMQEDSLVLFDELGAGTDPLEGAALAISILEYLRNFNGITVATTHYSELKHYALTREDVENASVEFSVETLSPTYRLIIGIPGKSNAFEISKKLGLPEHIIESAKRRMDSGDVQVEEILKEIELEKRAIEQERVESRAFHEEARKLKEKWETREEKLREQKEKVLVEARREAQSVLREAKRQSEEWMKELQKLKTKAQSDSIQEELQELRKQIKQGLSGMVVQEDLLALEKNKGKSVKQLKAGDEVFSPSFQKQGIVLSADDKKQEAFVQFGIMKLNMPYKALTVHKNPPKEFRSTGAGKIMKAKSQDTTTSVDVRGMDLENALLEVEKYLDNAYLANIPKVTIIHGVGTLVLKNGIRSGLRRYPHIKTMRDGIYGEGGIGVTVVEFKNDEK